MLILLTIFLLLFIPFAMLIIHMVRPKFSIQGFLAVLAVLAGWLMVLLARQDIPGTITLLHWQPAFFFPDSPSLLIDKISWYFAFGVITLALSSIVTSIAHLGQSITNNRSLSENKIEVVEIQEQTEKKTSPTKPRPVIDNKSTSNWQSWAGILILTSLGLVAVTAGNMLTLLLAWAALDILELFLLLGLDLQSKSRERAILSFSIRVGGIGMVLVAGIDAWSYGVSLAFNSIDQITSIYLILAVCLRLVVLPLQHQIILQHSKIRGFNTIFHGVPVAASLILVVRLANFGINGPMSPFLLGFIALVGLYTGFRWMSSEDELKGLPYWMLGIASLAIASAILNLPSVSIAWSIACLLSGGLIFSFFIHHKNLIPIAFLGFVCFSTLPFSPTWLGTGLFTIAGTSPSIVTPFLSYLFSVAFFLTFSLFLAGFIRNILRGIIPYKEQLEVHTERWVWFLFPIGLIFILAAHFLIGVMLYPELRNIPISGWIIGAIAAIISGIIWYLHMRYVQANVRRIQIPSPSFITKFLSLEWLFQFFGSIYHSLSRFIDLMSTILEGDGGILWAFVLFALIFVFLLR
jgi:hypothetical protein